jgi:hypothetical protein
MVRAFAQRFASAAVDRRSRRVDAAGWFDWLTTPLLSKRRRAPFWLLAAVTATGTLAMHILIPVLPLAAADAMREVASPRPALSRTRSPGPTNGTRHRLLRPNQLFHPG